MIEKIPIKIKRLRDDAVIPKYAHEFDSGFDLVAVEDVIIEPGETKLVPTGWAMQIPPGYELQIRPRSGISLKTKLRIANAPGTIDAPYRGEIGVIVDNIAECKKYVDGAFETVDGRIYLEDGGDTIDKIPDDYLADGSYIIRKGDRIAQAVLAKVPQAVFELVEELDDSERGEGGFGSSGVRA